MVKPHISAVSFTKAPQEISLFIANCNSDNANNYHNKLFVAQFSWLECQTSKHKVAAGSMPILSIMLLCLVSLGKTLKANFLTDTLHGVVD